MKINDVLINETSTYVSSLKKYARGHYPDETNDQDALAHLFSRSVHHAEEDDSRQDTEIQELKTQIAHLEELIKNLQEPNPSIIKRTI